MPISDIQRQTILEMGQANFTLQQIAAEVGVSVPTVRSVVGKIPPKEHPDADQIVEDYNSAKPVSEILRVYELTYGDLYGILRNRNIQLRAVRERGGRELALDRAVELYQEGIGVLAIRAETGISMFKLYGELTKRGVELRRKTWQG